MTVMPGEMRPMSFSSLNTFIECGEAYRLRYVEGHREDKPAWWSVGGSAVHAISEMFDRGELEMFHGGCSPEDWKKAIQAGIDEQLERYPDIPIEDWKTNSAGEGRAYWEGAHGKGHIDRYILWRLETKWELLVMPDGKQAIEIKVTGTIGGVAYIGYIDRVFVTPDGEVVIFDLKSGKSTPDTHLQHGVYRALLEQVLGVTASLGVFFKTREFKNGSGGLTKPVELDVFEPALLQRLTANVMKAREHDLFTPQPSWRCGTCAVRVNCLIGKTLPSPTTGGKGKKLKQVKFV